MARGSRRYVGLRRRLEELRRHLLYFLPPPPQSKTSFTDRELDLTRSFIVLAHAEIEAFCEDSALAKARAAKQMFHVHGKVTRVQRRIVSYHVGRKGWPWNEVTRPSLQTIDSAFQSYSDAIQNNHGIKRINLEKLLFPLGVVDSRLNATWLAQMDSFGLKRGDWAHKSIKALNPPDPGSESATVNQLLQGLLVLDRVLSRLR